MDRERQKALRAAIDAGEEALRHLDSAIVRLKDAETYGTWNLFSSHMSLHRRKYLRLNEAQAHIRQAEACLESCKGAGRYGCSARLWTVDAERGI